MWFIAFELQTYLMVGATTSYPIPRTVKDNGFQHVKTYTCWPKYEGGRRQLPGDNESIAFSRIWTHANDHTYWPKTLRVRRRQLPDALHSNG